MYFTRYSLYTMRTYFTRLLSRCISKGVLQNNIIAEVTHQKKLVRFRFQRRATASVRSNATHKRV